MGRPPGSPQSPPVRRPIPRSPTRSTEALDGVHASMAPRATTPAIWPLASLRHLSLQFADPALEGEYECRVVGFLLPLDWLNFFSRLIFSALFASRLADSGTLMGAPGLAHAAFVAALLAEAYLTARLAAEFAQGGSPGAPSPSRGSSPEGRSEADSRSSVPWRRARIILASLTANVLLGPVVMSGMRLRGAGLGRVAIIRAVQSGALFVALSNAFRPLLFKYMLPSAVLISAWLALIQPDVGCAVVGEGGAEAEGVVELWEACSRSVRWILGTMFGTSLQASGRPSPLAACRHTKVMFIASAFVIAVSSSYALERRSRQRFLQVRGGGRERWARVGAGERCLYFGLGVVFLAVLWEVSWWGMGGGGACQLVPATALGALTQGKSGGLELGVGPRDCLLGAPDCVSAIG
ncbi:unnamed protein product [Ostreobium quekettii]|uniref:Uncharacterized protein n=1 Tax=Ostreobium quekettii TaxID=121088 RepID=A0A8S1JC30_9CHLO|nr:unnamed protein product [Ostreobium quekettii]|eukprot:evm.model.scf_881EXC.4 EVM.evm.TU.scf_881EXC.4   scf_881EXC:28928-30154(+)